MPGVYRDEGVVLKTIKLGEADRIVTIFTRENGKVRAVAKGVRKTKSRFGGRLEPFTHVRLMLYRGRGELDTVTSAEIVEPFTRIHGRFSELTSAAVLVEVVEKITPDREQAFSTYALLLGGLRALADEDVVPGSVVSAFLLKLLSLSGFHPQLAVCAGCDGDGPLGALSPSLGGVLCEGCWREEPESFGVSVDAIQVMRDLMRTDFGFIAEDRVLAEVTQALRSYTEYHLERPLRSLQMLRAV